MNASLFVLRVIKYQTQKRQAHAWRFYLSLSQGR